jgi:hypothetical protein
VINADAGAVCPDQAKREGRDRDADGMHEDRPAGCNVRGFERKRRKPIDGFCFDCRETDLGVSVCPECKAALSIEGGRCLECRGRSMLP